MQVWTGEFLSEHSDLWTGEGMNTSNVCTLYSNFADAAHTQLYLPQDGGSEFNDFVDPDPEFESGSRFRIQ
jgi:hypothetical protein